MIEYLRPALDKLIILKKPEPKCWINVVSPTKSEIDYLKRILPINETDIHELKDIDQISMIEERKDLTFIIIRSPYNDKKAEMEYTTVPVGIFVMKEHVMTVSMFPCTAFEHLKMERFAFRKTQLVFRLMLISAKMYIQYLQAIRDKMYKLESDLTRMQSNSLVMDLLELEKDLVYFDTSLRSDSILIDRISKENTSNEFIFIRTSHDRRLIENVIDETKQAIQMVHTYSMILSNTLDAFASVISNNLNNIIKILTSITIIIALPTLIASFYGMNIDLPFQFSQNAFWFVIGLSFFISGIAIYFLWRRKLI